MNVTACYGYDGMGSVNVSVSVTGSATGSATWIGIGIGTEGGTKGMDGNGNYGCEGMLVLLLLLMRWDE